MGPDHVENVADLACRIALTYRKVAHIAFPVDLQTMEVGKLRSKRNLPHHTSDSYATGGLRPEDESLQRAADILNTGSKVAILAGRGALGASTVTVFLCGLAPAFMATREAARVTLRMRSTSGVRQ